MKKICVVTATRAEYGLLKPVMSRIKDDEGLELQILVIGAHLSPEFGLTYKEIEKDGFEIDQKIEMLLSSDTSTGVVKSMGVELISLAEYFEGHRPDMLVVLGDRYEMLMVASAALIFAIPIAHIHGGEITEGAFDDAIRHSITKMSQIHFASTEEYRHRIIQLGENPRNVFYTGALGVENIVNEELLDRTSLESDIDFFIDENTIMVTYHPVTLENIPSKVQFEKLLAVIEKNEKLRVIFTKANSDTDGRIINYMIDKFVESHKERCVAFTSLGRVRYLSALQFCGAVVGNSSSGIIEAPSFHIPTINIGNRQQGRIYADTVINCGYEMESIQMALDKAFSGEFQNQLKMVNNPYEKTGTSKLIVEKIKEMLIKDNGVKKHFYDVQFKEE